MKVNLDKIYKQLLAKTKKKKVQSPVKVQHSFLSAQEAQDLFDSMKGVKWDKLYNKWGKLIQRKTKTFYEGGGPGAASYMKATGGKVNVYKPAENYMNAYGDKGAVPIPFDQAPQVLQDLRKRLQQKYGLNFSLCYINFYYSGNASIGWHQDREEDDAPDPLIMVTVGGTRIFSVLEKGKNAWAHPTQDGDLVEMPVGFHDKYFHAVIKERAFVRPRISFTFRNPDLSPTGKWRWYGLKPQVWDGHAGQEYPPDAVYVGCKTSPARGNREGSIFGNGKNPLVSHRHCIADNEKDFRAYAEEKMQDRAFAKRVKDDLRGKHLLCWCVQDGPKRAKFCHARVWLELANPDMQEKWDDPPKGPNGEQLYFPNFMTPEETQAIFDAYTKLGPTGSHSGFLRFPDYSDVITPRMKDQVKQGKVTIGPFKDAPLAVRNVIARISKGNTPGAWWGKRNINYVSTIGYANEDAGMFYHQHGEDDGHDTPVWILSTGAARTWGLREATKDIPPGKKRRTGLPKTEIRFQVEPGSLLVLPNSYNTTHQHAVLEDKTARGMRIAPNMKAMDEIYYAEKKENDYRPSNAWERSKMKKGGKK